MEPFPCEVQSFPCQYLGLPLSTKALTRNEVMPLIHKVANKLPVWQGKQMNKVGRLSLVNMVLSSIPTYHLTVFAMKKWAIKRIDKIRRNFFWKGTDEVSAGDCLVSWKKVKRPKKIGGLGVLDLERFGRALRLWWLWYEWKDPDRPWVGTVIPCDAVDRQLFRASTVVQVGNGRNARFCQSPWLQGQAPMDIAPNFYRLAWRKNRTVREDLQDHNWIRGLWRMQDGETMAEFIKLWHLVQQVELNDEEDSITWKWTASGSYTCKSAYLVQHQGSHSPFKATPIWRPNAEGKQKIYAWLALQDRAPTTDNLSRKSWPCNETCSLCDQEPETIQHIMVHCAFAKQVWHEVCLWQHMDIILPHHTDMDLITWWDHQLSNEATSRLRKTASIIIYTWWNLWKERNRRIFQQQAKQPRQVLTMIKEEMKLRQQALGRNEEQGEEAGVS